MAAVTKMDQLTQANAASAEDCASAAEELNLQAKSLDEAVVELQILARGASTAAAAPSPVCPKSPRKVGRMEKSAPSGMLQAFRPPFHAPSIGAESNDRAAVLN